MKIVVWKSPKVLSSLLRRVFGVRRKHNARPQCIECSNHLAEGEGLQWNWN